MENIRRQFVNSLIEAEKYCLAADHVVHVSLKGVKDPKLLLRAFEDIYNALVLIISTVLRFEYLYKRISLKRDSKENLRIFINKCSKRYGLDEKDIGLIKEIIFLGKKHKESGMEFSNQGKFVIVDDELGTFMLDLEKIRIFLDLVKRVLGNSKSKFIESF